MEDILVQIAINLDNSYRDKYVDEEFLRWIFDEVVDYLDIREYVINGFSFGGESPMLFASGGYDRINKKIQFFDLALPMARNEVHNQMKVEGHNSIIATNILMVNTLLHELEHVHQQKKINDDSYEAYMLKLCEGNKETISTYDYIPSERFAENIAVLQTQVILNNMGIIIPEIDEYMEKRHNHWIIKGYVDEANNCMIYPLKRYVEAHGLGESNMSLDEAILTYPELEDRLFYGLPISDEEYLLVREKAGISNKYGIYSLW